MTTTLGTSAAPATQAPRDVRRAYRDLREPVLGGVAAGLAEHLGLSALIVRVGFVVGAVLGGVRHRGVRRPVGDAARRPAESARCRPASRAPPAAAAGPVLRAASSTSVRSSSSGRSAIGAVFVLQGMLGAGGWIWPLAIAIVGVGAALAAGRRGPARAVGRRRRADRPGADRARQRRLGVVRPARVRASP